MMRTIWKYQLALVDYQTVSMPVGAQILTAQMQGDICCLWAEVKSDSPQENRHIRIAGTGHTLNDEQLRYIDTVQLDDGQLIFHVYEHLRGTE